MGNSNGEHAEIRFGRGGGFMPKFHNPSRQALKLHWLMVEIPKKLFRGLVILSGNGKKKEFAQERLFGRVAKILISNTFTELVEMDFVDYGECAALLHIQDTVARFPVVVFIGAMKRAKNCRNGPRGGDF